MKLPADGLNIQSQSEKHESDRGIYTITMQKSGNKNTSPIKLKRPTSTTATVSEDDSSFVYNKTLLIVYIERWSRHK